MSFLETPRFIDRIAYGAIGGPSYLTEVVELSSGVEHVDSKWTYPRHSFDISTGIKVRTDIEDVVTYFHSVAGRFIPFRFKDHADWKSCKTAETAAQDDQLIGTGDSTDGTDGTAAYQLVKNYTTGALTRARLINKPVVGTTLVEVNGVLKTDAVHYNLDPTTGIITFTAGNVPLIGEVINAGYQFDVPVRFIADSIETDLNEYLVSTVNTLLIEVKIPA